MKNIKLAGIGVAALLVLGVGSCSMEQVEAGNRGVFVRMGEPIEVADPGLHFMNPLTTNIVTIPVRTQKLTQTVQTYTKDSQVATIKYSLTYRLKPDAALSTWEKNGVEWAKLLIPQKVDQAIKDVLGRSEAVKDAINRREAITGDIKVRLTKTLQKDDIILEGFEIRDISFSDKFEKAVEDKQVAVEKAQTAVNNTKRIEEESKQKIIVAEAEAEAMEIKNRALAGNRGLIEYTIAENWDGKLPGIVAGGTLPLLPLK